MPVVIDGSNTPTAGGIGYGDGTELAFTSAGTSGRPIVSGGSGAPTFRPYTLPAADGSANQVLQTNGSGALSFATPSSDYVLLSTTTVGSATNAVNITSPFTNTYKHFLVVVNNLVRDGVTGQSWGLRVYRGGSVITSSTYSWVYFTGGGSPQATYNDTSVFMNWPASNTNPTQGSFYFWNAFGPNSNNMFIQGVATAQPASPSTNNSSMTNNNAYNYASGTFGGIQFYNFDTSFGYVAAGTVFYVYGIK
jgi:hypothetical protein